MIQFSVNMETYPEGRLDIFNILGQQVRSFPLNSSDDGHVILWNAKDESERKVGVGTYLIRLSLFGKDGKLMKNETAKVLYLK